MTIASPAGQPVAQSRADIEDAGASWTGVLRAVDRPGNMASLYFGGGAREVVLRLPDGRSARARIERTSFAPPAHRVWHLRGLTPFAWTSEAESH